MPLQKLQFRPGVNRESTTYANEGGWFDIDKVRFRSGYPQKIGGWTLDTGSETTTTPNGTFAASGLVPALQPSAGSYWGVARSMFNWINLSGYNLTSLGTNLKYYIQNGVGGDFYDVTPIRLAAGAGSVTFAATTDSSVIECTDPGHGVQTGDFVTFSGAVSLGGVITAAVLNAEFQVTYVSSSVYTIDTGIAADSSDVGNGGASVAANYQLTVGSDIFTTAVGWGSGAWSGSTGVSATTVLSAGLSSVASTITGPASTSNTATTISVASTSGFAASGSILIQDEIITYSGLTSTSFTGCTRGTSGTTADTYSGHTGVVQYSTVTITVASTTGFSATGTISIDSETITYSGKTSTTFTGCVRGYKSTSASHSTGVQVTQYVTTSTGWGSAAPDGLGIGVQLRLWSEANFGQDLIINPRGGAMYYWAVNSNPNTFDRAQEMVAGGSVSVRSASVSIDSTCPSLVNHVHVSDASRFVIAFGCNDPSDTLFPATLDPLLIRWSDQENFGVWYPGVGNQAGDYRLSQGSEIVTALQSRQEILVWTDAALYSMQYLGAPYVWGFQIMGSNLSIISPNSVATANNVTYWMGTDKFYMYTGRVETLPCTVRQYVFDDINMEQSYQFFAGTNEGYNEVWWFYCSYGSSKIDRYVIFNHLERTWYYGTIARTAWLDSPLRDTPMAAGYDGQLIYHEDGVDDGTTNPPSAIVAYCQSSDFDIGDGHNFGLVSRIIPDVTFDGSQVNNPQVVFTVRPRQNPGADYGSTDKPEVKSSQNYLTQHTYNVQQFTNYAYVRIRGRQLAFKISSDQVGVTWQLGTPRLDIRADGRR